MVIQMALDVHASKKSGLPYSTVGTIALPPSASGTFALFHTHCQTMCRITTELGFTKFQEFGLCFTIKLLNLHGITCSTTSFTAHVIGTTRTNQVYTRWSTNRSSFSISRSVPCNVA